MPMIRHALCGQVLSAMVLLASLAQARTLLVWRDNPNTPVPPYDGGWAGAATNIQDAVDAAVDGDTVLVTNGLYNIGGRVAPGDTTLKTRVIVTNAVTVVSANGPEATVIAGQPHSTGGLGDTAVRGVYLQTNSVLSGFTVTNGFTRSSSSATTPSYVGGGIRCEGTGAQVTNCIIIGNQAAMRGGGVYQGTVSDCRIITNVVVSSSSSAGGGGVYGAAVRASLIEKNRTAGSSTDGGGTYACTLDRCTLRSNNAGRHGGGAYNSTLVSCTVESNSATQEGGGAHSPIMVTNSLIRWNTAGRSGGGLYKGAVANSVIASNAVTAASYFGGGYCGDDASTDQLVDCLVVGNSAITSGGGVYNAVLSNCVVRANRATGSSATTGSGGGYYASGTSFSAHNTRFLDNEANYRGGGAYQGKFFNCVFSGNQANHGGGFYGSTSYVLYNCSILGNRATTQYGGTYSGVISNSIVFANSAPASANYSAGTFRYSCADPLPTGAGNTNVNPHVSGYRDPHLLPGSPLIGAGAVSGWMAQSTDLDGDARAPGGVVDIGADQFTGSTLEGPLAVWVTAATNVCAVNWPHAFRAEAEGRVKGVSWEFGDGGTTEGVNPASHTFAAAGVYTVTVTVSNDTHTASGTYEVTAVDEVVYASPTGGHTPPFASWADAATNLQDAVDAVTLPGGRVLATNGVYDAGARVAAGQTATNRLVLDKPVRVQSVNGPEVTSIIGRWHSEATPLGVSAVRGVYVGGEAILAGFTVSNGATAAAGSSDNGRGGGIFLAAGGVATNCVMTGCRAWSGGGAASATDAAGELRGCVVSGNAALTVGFTEGQGGGVSGVSMVGGVIVSNTAYQGGGAYDCTLTASVLNGNTADHQGGGAYYGTLSRCRVRDNVAGTPSSGAGGGVYDATLASCLISGNTARQGGGVYGSSAAKSMVNCTVVDNRATAASPSQGGGGFFGNGTTYQVRNCIVYFNAATLGTNFYQGAITYSCALPQPTGTGNTQAAPMLADFVHGRVLPGSPCAGAGLYEDWMAGALDLDGEARASGSSVDMGADQLFEAGLTGPLAVAIEGPVWPYFPNTDYAFDAVVDGAAAELYWDFGDGQYTQNTARATHSWPEGEYTLRLTVSNSTHSAEATLLLHVAPDTRYVSLSGSHTPPFRSLETAATNLQAAADVVLTGGRIRVAAGVYDTGGRAAGGSETLINRLLVTNAVAVTAIDGPAVTFIVGAASGTPTTNGLGDGAVRGVRLAAGASLNGFTVTGGRTRWTTTATEGDYSGGGIYGVDGTCVVSGCVVTACAAASRGGGIYKGMVVDTTVESNAVNSSGNSLGWGGGICYASLISNCVIRANESRGSGGGVYMDARVVDTLLDGNWTVLFGGGGCQMATVGREMLRCTVVNNRAQTSGGGVTGAAMTDCLLTNNTATTGGGFYSTSDPVLKRCILAYNRASGDGGGAYHGTLHRCRLIGNTAGGRAGGIYFGTIYSSVVAGNRAGTNGGGTYHTTLECSTVVDNEAARGGGTYAGTAYYSIMYYNRAPQSPQYSATESYGCCTEPFESLVTYGPIREPPQLTGLRDPHLLAGSPCVDAGGYRGWMQEANGFDMDEEARYVFSSYDIGADERIEADLAGPLTVTVAVDQTTVTPLYAPVFWAEAAGRVGELRWEFDDGGSQANVNPVRHTFAAPGVYDVVVTVSNATHTASATQTVTVVAGDVYVSLAGGHVPPFASWAHAATNIQDAVDAAVWGGTVWLADGEYDRGGRPAAGLTHTNRVCVEKPITVRGTNGPAAMILGAWHEPGVQACGPGAVRGVYLGHAEARLADVTVTGGATGTDEFYGGGIYCAAAGAGGSNCVVTACQAYEAGGGVYGGTWRACELSVNFSGWYGGGAADATLDGCLVTGNASEYDGGGASECELTGCMVTDNTSLWGDGGGIYYGSALRCTFRGNTSYDDGGGSSDSDLVNCLLYGNTAAYGGGAAYGTLDACTVVSNAASVVAGGFYSGMAQNSIIWGNSAPEEPEWSNAYFRYCLIAPLPQGEADQGGNLMGNPEFVNEAAGDFRLRGFSPCVNAGEINGYAAQSEATDLDGQPRILGSAPEMGAYEYEPQPGQAARGTPIDWLDDYYAGPDWDAAELDDSDGDGYPAWMEYITRTAPDNGQSFFAIVAVARSEEGTAVSFDTALDRLYTVRHSASLVPLSWSNAAAPVEGTGDRVTVTVPDAAEAYYYQVRVTLP
jgi:PKD repeat protein